MILTAMADTIRTTVLVLEDLCAELANVAESGHVSTSWVIHDALRAYRAKRCAKQVKTR
ncbi:MAG: ribbon-helix-helix protein, CopG family [Candidatus Accumulibacter cognatus]|uniref:Ribbon-helix-helix protein, CopG family n=1 Tax=Candidatus Accumulibacter cognatus TaxID=2954383 RepID=A0A7D5SCQ2_9PROT|nr:MAG: ribbon-helix-helix protein, CopG family [Candidatus Accumulibacter cognatus]